MRGRNPMFKDLFSGLFTQASERIRNPLLGPFTGGWLVANWKLIAILFVSDKTIEQKIEVISNEHLDPLHLLVAPLIFALFYALVLPWVNYVLQRFQEFVNLKRKKHKLSVDTEYLHESVGRAQAQAELNRILAADQITQSQQEEIEHLKNQLLEQEGSASSQIAATEARLNKLQKEYEERSYSDQEAAKQKINRIEAQLENENKRAQAEKEEILEQLNRRKKDLASRIESHYQQPFAATTIDESLLLKQKFRFFHNPGVGPIRNKPITFLANGEVGEGANNNEFKWQVDGGKLELLQRDGKVHSRFYYLPKSKFFLHTGDSDLRSALGQYFVPEEFVNLSKIG
jgi:hypothetical protein